MDQGVYMYMYIIYIWNWSSGHALGGVRGGIITTDVQLQ